MDTIEKTYNNMQSWKNMNSNDSLRVLVIEDEDEIREFLVNQLVESGAQALGLGNGNAVVSALSEFRPTMLLLDQMMPGKSGNDVIHEIRGHQDYRHMPIMMVTGLDSEDDKVAALELGADDYVTKPFSVREVVARCHALARRSKLAYEQSKHAPQVLNFRELSVDFGAHKVKLRDQVVALTLTEFRILGELLKQSGQVLTRDQLRERALGNLNVTDRTIDVHMASLRKKLEHVGDCIETVRGVGYRVANTVVN